MSCVGQTIGKLGLAAMKRATVLHRETQVRTAVQQLKCKTFHPEGLQLYCTIVYLQVGKISHILVLLGELRASFSVLQCCCFLYFNNEMQIVLTVE